jgi:hypothetical protein
MFGKKIKIASILLLSILASSLSAATYSTAVPMRAGPVSLYGALGTNGNKIGEYSQSHKTSDASWNELFLVSTTLDYLIIQVM